MSHAVDSEAAAPATTPTPAAMALLSKEDYFAQLRAGPPIDRCPVCYEPSNESYTTPCKHTFCFNCITACAQSSHVCPLCRHSLYEVPPSAEDESDIDINDIDLDDGHSTTMAEINELAQLDASSETDLIITHFAWLRTRTRELEFDFESLIHIQLNELRDPALAKIIFYRHTTFDELPGDLRDDFCRPQWNLVALAILKVIKDLDGRVVSSRELLYSMRTELEAGLEFGSAADNSADSKWPRYSAELEAMRSFKEEVLFVLMDIVNHAQIVWEARRNHLKRTSWVAWVFRLLGGEAFSDWCLNLEERFLSWCGVRIKGHVRTVIESEEDEEEEDVLEDMLEGEFSGDGVGIMEAARTLAENVQFTFGAVTPLSDAPARTSEYDEDYDGDAD